MISVQKMKTSEIVHLQGISNPWLSLCLFNIVALDEQRQFDGKIGAEGWGCKLYLLRSTTPLLSGGATIEMWINFSYNDPLWSFDFKSPNIFQLLAAGGGIFSYFQFLARTGCYTIHTMKKNSWTSELKFYSHLTWRVSVSSDFPISFVTFNPT